jgi:formate hydrogenlyase transcriptional activator
LRDTAACDEDRELASRGVRRYVAAPLIVRGEVLGALLIASADPSPPLKIDVWMYENMAQQLALAIDNATQHEQVQRLSERLAQQNVYLREEIQSLHNVGEIAGDSPAIQRLYRDIQRVAPTTSTVLISGETGVGKELAARAIHAASPRAAQPMVKINCAAIPEGMFESELFGHERGAFTSAVERRIGRFELANGATLFLDEVGELPPAVQAKLLRVLQDGEFERVGGTRTLRTDVRIIAATNRDLLKSVAAGAFRSDLYYRLNVFPVHVPPLRERRSDIPALVQAFIGQFNRQMGKHVEAIDRASLDELCRGDWPGNVRELRHVIERAMIFCDGTTLHVDLPPAPAAGARSGSADTEHAPARLADVEADHIRRVLAQTRGVIEGPHGAAATLGLKPSTLRFRMKQLGIRRRP